MGFDLYQCQDFIEQKGLPEMQLNNLVDNLQNPQYVNVLKPQMMMQQPPMMHAANSITFQTPSSVAGGCLHPAVASGLAVSCSGIFDLT